MASAINNQSHHILHSHQQRDHISIQLRHHRHRRQPTTTTTSCSSSPSPQNTAIHSSRREALASLAAHTALLPLLSPPNATAAASTATTPTSTPSFKLEPRFANPLPPTLKQPSYMFPWDSKIIYYPRWMFGEWNVTSKLISTLTPLGARFVPEGFRVSQQQQQQQQQEEEDINATEEHAYALRFYSTLPPTFDNQARVFLGLGGIQDAVIADKAFNTKSTVSSFLGYSGAVSSVEYDPAESPLRQTVVLSSLGGDLAPLPPRRLELYVNALSKEENEESTVFRTSELVRQVLVAVRDVQVLDYEILNEYTRKSSGGGRRNSSDGTDLIKGRQRSMLYLQPQDELYFQSGGKPVVVYDYEFEMKRVKAPEDAQEMGAVACVLTPKQVVQCI